VLRAEDRGQPRAGVRGEAIDDVPQRAVDRRRVAHHADTLSVQAVTCQKPFGSQ